MKESIRRLLESKNYEDVCLGFSLWYKDVGELYFQNLMQKYDNGQGKNSGIQKTPFISSISDILIRTPGGIIIHLLMGSYWNITEYHKQNQHIRTPEYLKLKVFEI